MIINSNKIEDIEIENQIGEDTAVDVTVDTENMAFFYEMMSKNMYSDPIGSIVREITSNCFDAHIENGSQEPVIIEGLQKEDDYYIRFIDKGVGISPSRWNDTIRKYLSSTKRTSNDYLGAFGLGSKSPFAYVDLFHIITAYDGIEYHYTMEKSPNGIPRGDLLVKREVNKPNGTIIEFPIEGGRAIDEWESDWKKFQRAIDEQLMYFDNVYVKDFGIDNHYKIYEGRTFKYRLNTSSDEMHILLGKVKYPIKWDRIGRKIIKIPIGIKFNIGDLMITPNREDIRYTDENIKAINKGIEDCIIELKEYLNKGYDNIEDYWKALKDDYSTTIRINDEVQIKFTSGYYPDNSGQTHKYPFKFANPYLAVFGKDSPLKIPENPFFLFTVKSTISSGRLLTKEKDFNKNLWKYLKGDDYRDKVERISKKVYRTTKFISDKLKNYSIQDGYIVGKRSLGIKSIAKELGLLQNTSKRPNLPNYNSLTLNTGEIIEDYYKSLEGQQKTTYNIPAIGEWGNVISLVKLYKKEITKTFVNLTESYDTYQVKDEDRRRFEEERAAVRNLRAVRNLDSIYANNLDNADSSKVEHSYKVLTKLTGFIVYGDNSQREFLKSINSLMNIKVNSNNYFKKSHAGKKFRILTVNKSDIKRMEELKNSYNIEEFTSNHKSFIKEATRLIVHPIYKEVSFSKIVFKLCPSISELNKKIYKYSADSYEVERFHKTKLGQETLRLIIENKWYDKEIVEEAEELLRISKDLSIFNLFNREAVLSYEEEKDLSTLLIKKGYMPDIIYTSILTEDEKSWIKDWLERGIYLEQVEKDLEKVKYSYRYSDKINNRLTIKTINEKSWLSYPKLQNQNRSARTSMLLLEMKHSQ